VGLVGYPSVGKSTLISTISNAKPKIAEYEFTTLIPNLGVVNVGEYDSFLMADIPGIIEGASGGKGLGLEFLKHIERTKSLLLLIDIANYRDIEYQYNTLLVELERYSKQLATKRLSVAITKCDTMEADEVNLYLEEFLNSIGLTPNGTLEQYKADSRYISYGFQGDFGEELPTNKPLFLLPISAVSHLNLDTLRYSLYNYIRRIEGDE